MPKGIATGKSVGAKKAPRAYTPYRRPDNRDVKFGKWYKNPSIADITVLYGPQGERKFVGHQFVLTNTTELIFKTKPPVSGRHANEIILNDDDPDALESLFKFAYHNRYTAPYDPKAGSQHLAQMDHHTKVLVIAHKYAVDLLQAYALTEFDTLLSTIKYPALDRIVKQIYDVPLVPVPPTLEGKMRQRFKNMSLQTQVQQEEGMIEKRSNENRLDSETLENSADEEEEEEEEEDLDWDLNGDLDPGGTPTEYLKQRVLGFSVELWHRHRNCKPLGKLATEVPEYARDLAIYALMEGYTVEPSYD